MLPCSACGRMALTVVDMNVYRSGRVFLLHQRAVLELGTHTYTSRHIPAIVSMNCRAIAQAVSRRALTSEARVSQCGICGGQTGTGTRLPASSSGFFCRYHSAGAPYSYHLGTVAAVQRQYQTLR
jgi:hypothetical protein